MFELDVTHAHAPHPREHNHLRMLLAYHLRRLIHRLEAKRGAAIMQCEFSDADAEIEQESAGTQDDKRQETRDERRNELVVDRV